MLSPVIVRDVESIEETDELTDEHTALAGGDTEGDERLAALTFRRLSEVVETVLAHLECHRHMRVEPPADDRHADNHGQCNGDETDDGQNEQRADEAEIGEHLAHRTPDAVKPTNLAQLGAVVLARQPLSGRAPTGADLGRRIDDVWRQEAKRRNDHPLPPLPMR